ncbi:MULTISPECIES: CsbD family protein [unclassified Bradyrhizobium]|uniref:CsbD family protein n=1 Tax=unclassified Bradyrhizobium TaxID=2631580 RepID=UPI001FF1A2CA|nr:MULTISPECIES: CsbD family protein [unclassified Bradyrhizobium]MCJ9699597.1 CsbD family protein [Bradyrhizobium sp. SHOUNA76]MCJ9729849.1 CsbD family protein [Bradyrhizobium sp. PRIMUS42]
MGKTKDLQRRIVGKTRQAIGEIIGDQDLHDDGKAQAQRGRDEQVKQDKQDKPSALNPLKKLKQLT